MGCMCKLCGNEYIKIRNNQEYCSIKCRNLFWSRDYYSKNKEIIIEDRKNDEDLQCRIREYRKTEEYKNRISKYNKNKRVTDPKFKIKLSIIDRIRHDNRFDDITDIRKNLETYLGYDLEILYNKLFISEDIIKDYLLGKLHLDHIISYHWFLSVEIGDGEFKKCWNVKNLRLIPKEENLKKLKKSFDFDLIKYYDLIDILPKGINEIWKDIHKEITHENQNRVCK